VTGSEDGTIKIWDLRNTHLHRNYNNEAPVNDVCVHPNQGELISCDQAGRIKQWDLSENICTHELTPAGDVPIRSVTLASDGSCLVAGNNKVANPARLPYSRSVRMTLFPGKMLCMEDLRRRYRVTPFSSRHEISGPQQVFDALSA
jgi:WD40 repeat protein